MLKIAKTILVVLDYNIVILQYYDIINIKKAKLAFREPQ